MATDFHFFPFLPWELRDKIWKFAIRPAVPGAHVFSIRNGRPKHTNPDHQTPRDDYPHISESSLAAPRCLPRGVDFSPAAQEAAPISWALNNPSTYLVDSGLWAACKESRLAIENGLQIPGKRRKVWSFSEVESFREEQGRFTLPETAMYTVSDNARRRYLTVFPGQDLVILQSSDIRFLNWNRILNRSGFPYHMALAYDPAWDERIPDLNRMVYDTAEAGSFALWFIDYRIKRNPRYTGLEGSSKIFYASDRRFVEVEVEELGGWAGHDRMWDAGYEVPTKDIYLRSCSYGFVEQLSDMLDDKRGHMEGYDLNWVDYGLLACEPPNFDWYCKALIQIQILGERMATAKDYLGKET
ncbi:hypothetical protein F5144DRAFT_637426 [Chaetomium tenue]|uniref:Uncharacterized protein n=1 Tax=Chaetomium tenue TaxID=1854479 RepID=A0ACB7PR74_9PEZI|nr:hypothetical protein F5144DRAFT_637426 [Chaetomium globosum]